MEKSVYEARWLLMPMVFVGFAFVTAGVILS